MAIDKNDVSTNNKRIAKNTLILYVRMFFLMVVSLFTTRIVLDTLGVSDFGIFNVIGGVVLMMNVVNGAMSVSTQRYLTFELGKNDMLQFKRTFSMCMNIFIALSLLLLVVGETVGLWFVNKCLAIPVERMTAANWVYQFALLSCVCSLLTNPYNATIVSHERMNVYAYISIAEVLLKLCTAYMLLIIPFDRLATYGTLTFLSSFIIVNIYRCYCKHHFPESHFMLYWEKNLFKRLLSYSGWNLFGSLSGVAKGQGLNVLINLFFGPSVNASRGIAYQVNGVVHSFFTNFYTAVRPQITKYYAQGDLANMHKLVFTSSRMAFFLILMVSLPLIIETPFIIQLWLGQMPEYVVPFIRLIIVITAIDSMSTPLMTAIHATGNNRLYQLTVGIIMIMTLPISYVFLRLGYSPIYVFIVSLILSVLSLFVRLGITQKQIGLSFGKYVMQVVLRSLSVAAIACLLPLAIHGSLENGWICTVCVSIASIICCMVSAYYVGLNNNEKQAVIKMIKDIIKKIKK